jgi:hypothetical protein
MKLILKTIFLFSGILILSSFTHTFHGDNSKTILFVPYQPMMHLSDADADIAENSKVNVQWVRVLLRNSLNEKLMLRFREKFYVRQLLEMGTANEKDDLNNFYDSESFYLSSRDTTKKNPVNEVASSSGNPYFGIFGKSSRPDYASSYMNVSLSKPVLFKELSEEYEASYFVVLTQLEIKTHYNECIDIANRVFRREFLVHFSVFDAQGNQTGGTAVSYEADSNINSINKITASVFPELVEKIRAHVSAATLR